MKKISVLLAFLIVVGICISAVSAEILEQTVSGSKEYTTAPGTGTAEGMRLGFYNIQNYKNLDSVFLRSDSIRNSTKTMLTQYPYYEQRITAKYGSQVVGEGTAYYNALWSGGEVSTMQCWIEFDWFDPGTLTGTKDVQITPESGQLWNEAFMGYTKTSNGIPTIENPIIFKTATTPAYTYSGLYVYHLDAQWFNEIDAGEQYFTLNRTVNGTFYSSNLAINDQKGSFEDSSTKDIKMLVFPPYTWTIETPYGKTFSGSVGTTETPIVNASVIVYIKNSQTGALIADANIVIDALVNGTYYPVVNRTEPSGIFSITLQQTGGGQPNPDSYRLIVTADGYYNPTPAINFTVDAYTKLSTYLYLDPIAGGPANENKTFIDFFVRDMASNPISGASVKFGKDTLITNSAGYTVFEVDKNNTYSWTVSKSGYGSLTGNAVIGNDPRHTIRTCLAPIVTPTTPTTIPTSPPIGPTPTMTAPTGEHVSNWLEWFAAHFGMILGGGVEIGKIFMWLCFTVPVGVYVGKEAKAGAAGFMAGAGIVTLFFVLIGWVPIWLVVLLALIIGLLYAKAFNAQDNGGGR